MDNSPGPAPKDSAVVVGDYGNDPAPALSASEGSSDILPTSEPESVKSVSRGLLFGAAILTIGAIVTFTQLVVALMLGISRFYDWRMSTGGIAAIAVGIYIAIKCRTWKEFRNRIWPWALIAAVLAASLTFMDSSTATATANNDFLPRKPQPGLVSQWEKIDTPAVVEWVEQPTGKVLVEESEIMLCHAGQPTVDCVNRVIADYDKACVRNEVSTDSRLYTPPDGDTSAPRNICEWRIQHIKEAQAHESYSPNWTQSEAGWVKLVVTPETERVSVVTQEQQTHVATCVLGILGECKV